LATQECAILEYILNNNSYLIIYSKTALLPTVINPGEQFENKQATRADLLSLML